MLGKFSGFRKSLKSCAIINIVQSSFLSEIGLVNLKK